MYLPELKEALEIHDYNWEMRTTEVRTTDKFQCPGGGVVNAMATGQAGGSSNDGEQSWPTFGVTWKKTGTDVSILVAKNAAESICIYFYNLTEQPKNIQALLWRLKPGAYTARMIDSPNFEIEAKDAIMNKIVTIEKKGDIVDLEIPLRKQVYLEIRKQQ